MFFLVSLTGEPDGGRIDQHTGSSKMGNLTELQPDYPDLWPVSCRLDHLQR